MPTSTDLIKEAVDKINDLKKDEVEYKIKQLVESIFYHQARIKEATEEIIKDKQALRDIKMPEPKTLEL